MTDLEITRLCAEAMGIPTLTYEGLVYVEMNVRGQSGNKYDPLHDDAQAMALVKRFHVELYSEPEHNHEWRAGLLGDEGIWNADLNRAICECVAKMQRKRSP